MSAKDRTRKSHLKITLTIVIVVCIAWVSGWVVLYKSNNAVYALQPDHIARESELFRTVKHANEQSRRAPIQVNLQEIYGQDLQRFAIQCPYGEPEVTARYLGVSEEELPGLRSFWQLNSETVAALILDFGDGNYETSEWDFRSIVWCPPSDLEWYTDFDVTFFERRGDPSYVPSFKAHVHAAHRDS